MLEAAFDRALADGSPLLIEATCNQVNQEGGYTGQTPDDFRARVVAIATRRGFDPARLILGATIGSLAVAASTRRRGDGTRRGPGRGLRGGGLHQAASGRQHGLRRRPGRARLPRSRLGPRACVTPPRPPPVNAAVSFAM
ncbi:class II D-tagatose-bisphosphate aldolase non-catalytic subunit [Salinicola tamaricis]|uniref:class II D-tagatose-bisphosphate aldolase non-catalytic subunit n=1 Tax=Salinicola tamaricis TaxID=1771309 RepID=UPI003BF593D2